MDVLNFDEFFYDVWNQISFDVVDTDKWKSNQEFIREITFDFYNIYRNTCYIENGFIESEMNTSRVAQLFTLIFKKIEKYKI